MERKTVGVFFGSQNPEHDVSILTGQLIMAGLKKLGHIIVPIYIGKDGEWYVNKALGDLNFFKKEEIIPKKFGGWSIAVGREKGKLLLKRGGIRKEEHIIDIAFPAIHGALGEDGTIQGLFEMMGVPYVGCGVSASSLGMDKVFTKRLYKEAGIRTTPFIFTYKHEWQKDRKQFLKEAESLAFPLFVKPARTGSSIGIAKVDNLKDLEFAIEVALHYDEKVLVEKTVSNLKDITCALLGNEDPRPSLLQESLFNTSEGFFSYNAKYLRDGGAQLGVSQKGFIIPADLDKETTKQTQDLAVRIYKLFECAGTARVDFLYDSKDKKLYANEINTLPGTLYHHLWKASGVSLSQLLENLIEYAEEEHKKRKDITKTFPSNILKQSGGGKLGAKFNSDGN